MNKHTPGPWNVYTWGNSEDEAHGFSICARGYVLPLSDVTGDIDEAEANARLIAAAPEMYEVLEAIKLAVEMRMDPHAILDENSPILDGLRDVLAKVK